MHYIWASTLCGAALVCFPQAQANMDPHFFGSLSPCCSPGVKVSFPQCGCHLLLPPTAPLSHLLIATLWFWSTSFPAERAWVLRLWPMWFEPRLNSVTALWDGTHITGTDCKARCSATPQPQMNKHVCVFCLMCTHLYAHIMEKALLFLLLFLPAEPPITEANGMSLVK